MDTKFKKRLAIILSVIIAIVVLVPTVFYFESTPIVTVKDGIGTTSYTGPIGSSLNNTIFNASWANATISQNSGLKSVFYLYVGPVSVYGQQNGGSPQLTAVESFPIEFGGVLAGNLHPNSVTFTIGTNGNNTAATVNILASSSRSDNVSFSEQNQQGLTFSGNKNVSTSFGLLNVSFPLFSSSTHTYVFNYATAFLVTSSLTSSFVRFTNLTVTLNGLTSPVSDSISIEISQGGL